MRFRLRRRDGRRGRCIGGHGRRSRSRRRSGHGLFRLWRKHRCRSTGCRMVGCRWDLRRLVGCNGRGGTKPLRRNFGRLRWLGRSGLGLGRFRLGLLERDLDRFFFRWRNWWAVGRHPPQCQGHHDVQQRGQRKGRRRQALGAIRGKADVVGHGTGVLGCDVARHQPIGNRRRSPYLRARRRRWRGACAISGRLTETRPRPVRILRSATVHAWRHRSRPSLPDGRGPRCNRPWRRSQVSHRRCAGALRPAHTSRRRR